MSRQPRSGFHLTVVVALTCFVAGLAFGTAAAGTVRGLYTARVAVPDQGREARSDALRVALEELFVRISGSEARELASSVEEPGQLLLQYQYQNENDGLVLQAHFDPNAVERFLGRHDAMIWGRQRPETLAWVAVQAQDYRAVLDRDTQGGIADLVRESAQRRGLPLSFPLMDTQDQSEVSFIDVWGGFDDRVREASKRYQPDAVLVGRVERVATRQWRGRWTLLQGDQRRQWESGTGRRRAVLAEGIDVLADHYVGQFAARPGDQLGGEVSVSVSGVGGLDGYARVMDYLASVSPVQNVRVTAVQPAALELDIALSGDVAHFAEVVRLGRVLRTADRPSSPSADEEGPAALHYTLASP